MTSSTGRTPGEKQALLDRLERRTGGKIHQFFVAHDLGLAYEQAGKYESKAAKIAAAMSEAQRLGIEDEIYDALEATLNPGGKLTQATPAPEVSSSSTPGATASSPDSQTTTRARAVEPVSTGLSVATAAPAEVMGTNRRIRWWTSYADMPIDEAIKRIDRRADRFGKYLLLTAEILFFGVCFIGAVSVLVPPALSIVGLKLAPSSPLQNPWIGFLAAILALLQLIDWAWPKAPISVYRTGILWLKKRSVSAWRRRVRTRLFAMHGTQEVAARYLPPEEAQDYSVAIRKRKRQRRQLIAGGAGLALLVGLSGYAIVFGNADRTHKLGESFPLSHAFSVAVKGRPTCHPCRSGAVSSL